MGSGEPDTRPFTALCVDDADIKTLVQLRTRHQTRDAEKGTRQVNSSPPSETPSGRPQTERERTYMAILKAIRSQTNSDNEQKGVATGLARSERHKTAPAGTTGNAANAAVVAENESKRVFISFYLRGRSRINHDYRHSHGAPQL